MTLRTAGRIASACAVAICCATAARAQTAFNCSLLAHVDSLPGSGNDVWGYADPQSGADYAIIGTSFGTGIYNVANPSAPYLTGFIVGPTSPWRDFATYRSFLYIGSEGGGGVQIVSLADPEHPGLVATYAGAGLSTSHTLTADTVTARLYANGSNGGMRILSLANPTAPIEVGVYLSPYVHDCYARGDTVYAACINSGQVIVLDTSDPASPDTLARFATERGRAHNAWPSDAGRTLFVTDETGGGRLSAWDLSLPASPIQVDAYTADPLGDVHNVHVLGERAYLSHYTSGIVVLDVSDPTLLIPVGFYDTYPQAGGLFNGAWSVFPHTQSGNAYIGDIESGLFVVSFNGRRGAAIAGRATQAQTGSPLAGVEIRLLEAKRTALTDADGRYEIRTAEGEHTVTASRLGLVSESFRATLAAGATATYDIALFDNTADVALAPADRIDAIVAAGESTFAPLVVANVGGGVLTYAVRDEYEATTVGKARRAVRGEPPLVRILRDPLGDVIPPPGSAPSADLAALHAGLTPDSLYFRFEIDAPAMPESAFAFFFFDLDQDAASGVADPLASTFGYPASNDIGAERVLVWDLAGRFLPDVAFGIPGAAALLSADFSEFYGLFIAPADSNGATIAFDLAADLGDDGHMGVAGAVGIATYLDDFPFLVPIGTDLAPAAGHAIIGVERRDAPWLSAEPVSGRLVGARSDTTRVRFDAAAFDRDTTLAATLVVETNDVDEPEVRVPVSLRVFVRDRTPPGITVSLLQNPIFSWYVEVVAFADEPLAAAPALVAGDSAVALAGDAGAARPTFRGALTLGAADTLTLSVAAADTAGNDTAWAETFVAYEAPAGAAVRAGAPGGALALSAPEGAIPAGTFLLLRALAPPRGGAPAASGRAIFVGPVALALGAPVTIEMPADGAGAASAPDDLVIVRIDPTGDLALPTFLSPDRRTLVAETDRLGAFAVRRGTGAAPAALPERAALGVAAPNPTSRGAAVALALPRRMAARLAVYSVAGRRVRELLDGTVAPGPRTISWDGADDEGRPVAPGLYLFRLETPDGVAARKVTVLR